MPPRPAGRKDFFYVEDSILFICYYYFVPLNFYLFFMDPGLSDMHSDLLFQYERWVWANPMYNFHEVFL